MAALSSRDKNLLVIIGVLVLYALLFFSYKGKIEQWNIAKRIYERAHAKLQAEKALIAARGDWEEKLEEAVKIIPAFPEDAKNVDTHWQTVMDTLAEKSHISITRSQAPQEKKVGNLSEMVIECKDWEGTLKSIVNFLWSLHQEGASLDIQQLYIHPIQNRPGFLKGYFTLSCAYMFGERDEEENEEKEGNAKEEEKEPAKAAAPATTNETRDAKQALPEPDTSAGITPSDTANPVAASLPLHPASQHPRLSASQPLSSSAFQPLTTRRREAPSHERDHV
ncbi:MAG: hypothetical protein IJR99_02225 [Kiritimatiellae bacterium]|nr:hypothetical protein [Kiritimatiellia bacterium]